LFRRDCGSSAILLLPKEKKKNSYDFRFFKILTYFAGWTEEKKKIYVALGFSTY